MSNKTLHQVVIETESGLYTLPAVDLEKYNGLLHPTPYGNPCLQIINEECSVLSVTWDRVIAVTAVSEGVVHELEPMQVRLWRRAA